MRNNILRVLWLVTVFVMLFAFAVGCSKPKGEDKAPADVQQTAEAAAAAEEIRELSAPPVQGAAETAGNITVLVPDGWRLQPGGPGGIENDNSAFVYSGDDPTSPYIWVNIQTRGNIESSIATNASEEIEPFMLGGVKWQGKSGAFYGEIDGKLYIIMLHPSLKYDNEYVLAVVESLTGR